MIARFGGRFFLGRITAGTSDVSETSKLGGMVFAITLQHRNIETLKP